MVVGVDSSPRRLEIEGAKVDWAHPELLGADPGRT